MENQSSISPIVLSTSDALGSSTVTPCSIYMDFAPIDDCSELTSHNGDNVDSGGNSYHTLLPCQPLASATKLQQDDQSFIQSNFSSSPDSSESATPCSIYTDFAPLYNDSECEAENIENMHNCNSYNCNLLPCQSWKTTESVQKLQHDQSYNSTGAASDTFVTITVPASSIPMDYAPSDNSPEFTPHNGYNMENCNSYCNLLPGQPLNTVVLASYLPPDNQNFVPSGPATPDGFGSATVPVPVCSTSMDYDSLQNGSYLAAQNEDNMDNCHSQCNLLPCQPSNANVSALGIFPCDPPEHVEGNGSIAKNCEKTMYFEDTTVTSVQPVILLDDTALTSSAFQPVLLDGTTVSVRTSQPVYLDVTVTESAFQPVYIDGNTVTQSAFQQNLVDDITHPQLPHPFTAPVTPVKRHVFNFDSLFPDEKPSIDVPVEPSDVVGVQVAYTCEMSSGCCQVALQDPEQSNSRSFVASTLHTTCTLENRFSQCDGGLWPVHTTTLSASTTSINSQHNGQQQHHQQQQAQQQQQHLYLNHSSSTSSSPFMESTLLNGSSCTSGSSSASSSVGRLGGLNGMNGNEDNGPMVGGGNFVTEEIDELGPMPRDRCNTWPLRRPNLDINAQTSPLIHEKIDEESDLYDSSDNIGSRLGASSATSTALIGSPDQITGFSPGMSSPTLAGNGVVPSSGASDTSESGGKAKSTTRRNAWGNMSYADLITQAIIQSPEKRLTLSQVYEWMVQNVPYFRDKGDSNSSAGWKNSIRHNLSLHSRFMRIQNEGAGKSSWWVINPDAKPGRNPRRRERANTLETTSKAAIDKSRRGARKRAEKLRSLMPSSTNSISGSQVSISSHDLGFPDDFEPMYRPRTQSTLTNPSRVSPSMDGFNDFDFPPWIDAATSVPPIPSDLVDRTGEMRLDQCDPNSPAFRRNMMNGIGEHKGEMKSVKIEEGMMQPPSYHELNSVRSPNQLQNPLLRGQLGKMPQNGYGFNPYNPWSMTATGLQMSTPHSCASQQAASAGNLPVDLENLSLPDQPLDMDMEAVLRHELSQTTNNQLNFDI